MSVRLTHPIDPIELADAMTDGQTHVELFYANTPDGVYTTSAVRVALVAATYEYEFTYSGGNPSQWFKVVYWNGLANSSLKEAPPFHGGGGTTLVALRRKLGRRLRDLEWGVTTANGSTTSAICAEVRIARYRDDHFNNWLFNRLTGTPEWTVVTDWATATDTFTLAPAIASVGSGVEFEVTRRWTPEEYRDALNWAIVASFPILSRAIITTSVLTEADTYQYTIPAHIRFPASVEVESNNNLTGATQDVRGFPWKAAPHRIIHDGLQQIVEFDVKPTASRRLRITGTGALSQLYSDDDYVEVVEPQTELLIALAANYLYRLLPNDAASSDIDRYQQLADYYMAVYTKDKDAFATARAPRQHWSAEARSVGMRRSRAEPGLDW